jgi:hypothetical protein
VNTVLHVTRAARLAPCILVFSLFTVKLLPSQQIVVPEPEAPTTIFSTKIGDAGVDFNLGGSWDGSLSFSTGFLFVPGLPLQLLDAFPAMDTGFHFAQSPNLTASVVLMQKYFLDLAYFQDPTAPGSTRNTLTLGYRGDRSEVIRSILLGNGGIAIPSSGFMEIPDQPASSLGASALFASGMSTHELLLRWDSAEEKTKTFLGPNELLEETIPLDGYVRGRFFFLPDAGVDPQSLVVYIEDTQRGSIKGGDNKIYRIATLDDASLDAAGGLVSLKTAVKGRVLVYYKKGGVAIGDATLGRGALPPLDSLNTRRVVAAPPPPPAGADFDFSGLTTYFNGQPFTARGVSVGTTNCLLLWEPGDTSPFEIDSSYAFTDVPPADPSRIFIQLQAKGAGGIPSAAQALKFQSLPDQQRFVVFANSSFRADFRNMYPFTDPDGFIYGQPRDALSGYLSYQLYVQLLTPSNEFNLEPNIVPGSVRVTVNGITETRFEADPASGRVTFLFDVRSTDRIEIRYRVTSAGLSGGDILFAWRDTIAFSDAMKLSFAAGIRWNADPWSFSQKPYAKSGTILAQAGLSGEGENWSYSVLGGVAYTNPDTTGVLRLFGMEGNSLVVDLSENNAFPAAPAVAGETPAPATLSQLNRGYLFYKDYRAYDAFGGSSLNTITWSGAVAVPYADGGRMGPYNVLGSAADSNSGASLVFDFDVPSGGWVGAQLLPAAGTGADLSTAQAITIELRTLNVSGNFQVYLQVGNITEDIDGDGIFQAESTPTDPGFPFYDQAHGVTLKVGGGPKGQGNGRLDSEDRDGNGILDWEDASRVLTITDSSRLVFSTGADSGWQKVTIPLDGAMRSKLTNSRQLRLLIVATGAAAVTGKFLIDNLSLEGASEHGAETPPGSGSVSVKEIAEPLAAFDPGSGQRLADVFPTVKTMFHPNGEPQEVLEALWGSVLGGSYTPLTNPLVITAYASATQGTGGIQYDTIALYIRIPAALAGSPTISFSLKDTSGRGISWDVDSSAISVGPWHEMKASKRDGKVRIDGNDTGASPPRFDAGYGSIAQLQVTVSGAASGAIYIDEVQCQDPEGSVGAALDAEVSYKHPDVIIQAGGVPLLGNFAVHQKLSLISPGFSTLYGIPSQNEDIYSKTELGVDALFSSITVDLLLREFAGTFTASGGHRVTVPSVSFPVALTDAFSLTWLGEFTRENLLEIKPLGGVDLLLDTESDGTESLLSQRWDGKLTLAPIPNVALASEIEVFQAVSGYPLPSLWYGQRWVREMGLVLPWTGGQDVARREKLDISFDIQPSPIGIHASTQALVKSADFTASARNQENDLDLSLALLLHFGSSPSNDLSISLGYQRLVTLLTSPEAGERFISEAQTYGSLIGLQSYLLGAVPFAELFQDNSSAILPLWAEASLATYSPRATFSVQRSFGSHLYDLLLPSSVDLTLGQDLKKDGVLSSTQIFILPKISSRALNLFGQLGSNPLMPFARTDEYGLSFGASLTAMPGQAFRWTETTADLYASIEGFAEEEFTLTHSFKWEVLDILAGSVSLTDATQLAFQWSMHPAGGLAIPLIPSDIGHSGFLSHKESAELTFRYASPEAFHPFTVLLEHTTSLVFPKNGSIEGKGGIGFDQEILSAGLSAYRIAFELSLTAKLKF